MTSEMEACTIICNSIREAGGWAYKIPDPSSDFGASIKRPLDLIGALWGLPLFIEMKWKKNLLSLDLQEVADHQIASLCTLKDQLPMAQSWVMWAVSVGRGDHRYYTLPDCYEVRRRRDAHENFKVSELKGMPYLTVKRDRVDLTPLKNLFPSNLSENLLLTKQENIMKTWEELLNAYQERNSPKEQITNTLIEAFARVEEGNLDDKTRAELEILKVQVSDLLNML